MQNQRETNAKLKQGLLKSFDALYATSLIQSLTLKYVRIIPWSQIFLEVSGFWLFLGLGRITLGRVKQKSNPVRGPDQSIRAAACNGPSEWVSGLESGEDAKGNGV